MIQQSTVQRMNRQTSARSFGLIIFTAALATGMVACAERQRADAAPEASATSAAPDNAELKALCDADQADRQDIQNSDWKGISQRDIAREKRVREMLEAGTVNTAQDYFHAALICQHSMEVEGIQLAHELSMISAALGGGKSARWLMAASYDRLLNRLDQPQRFGTQYLSKGDGPMALGEVRPGVTDSMRAAINVPSLAKAKEREEEIRKTMTQVK